MEPTVIGGVKAFILTPKEIRPENRNRLLIHVHGGGYVYNPGEAGTGEGTLMAAFGGYKSSGYGRETDQLTLNNYQQVKNVLDNHDQKPLGFFA